MDIRIDPEFRDLIPPLSNDERAGLEAAIINDGCQDAIKVWEGVIIDGHNRYAICTANGIPFETTGMDFNSRDGAKLWIIKNQLHRRNINKFTRGKLILKMKPLLAAEAQKNRGGFKGNQHSGSFSNWKTNQKKADTHKDMAKLAEVGFGTMYRIEQIDKAAASGMVSPEVIDKLHSGELSINAVDVAIKMADAGSVVGVDSIKSRPIPATVEKKPRKGARNREISQFGRKAVLAALETLSKALKIVGLYQQCSIHIERISKELDDASYIKSSE
jgi:hypothetical protein